MLTHYLKIAFRKLWSSKAFSLLNIIGLATGMTACFLIYQYVSFELSYDGFHKKADRIYRLVTDIKTPTEVIKAAGPAWAVPPFARNDFPEIEAFVRLSGSTTLVRIGDKKFQEEKAFLADSSFFKVFDFKLLKGNPHTALTEPFSVVISESTAKKYFDQQDPVGQSVLLLNDGYPTTIKGVMEDLPANSQIAADMLISMSTVTRNLSPGLDSQWSNYGATAFLMLREGASAKSLEAKFPAFLERRNGTEMKRNQMYATLLLEPLKDVYLHSTRDGNKSGNMNNVYIFSIIAVFILLIACINFINLTTARAAERAKEVGVRKVVGAGRTQLAWQFIGESILICSMAFLLTLIFVALLVPLFNQLAGKTISTGLFHNGGDVLKLFAASLGIGVLAGIYPALVLTSFKPILVLKGRFATGSRGILLRKGLVITQFTISIALIIATIVIYNQMNYMRSQDLGFDKEQMLIIDTNYDPARDAFRQAVEAIPAVKSTAVSSSVPSGTNPGAYSEIENKQGELQVANLDLYFVDFDYLDQFKLKLVAGRGFSRDFLTDSSQAMILNETAVKLFGYGSPGEAIGRRYKQWGSEGQIVGVVKDFHFRSLEEPIKPLSMRIGYQRAGLVSVKVASDNLPATIAAVENKWKELIPDRPFNYYFLDEFFDKQYRDEQRFGRLFLHFAALAIIISCLGLLGLASYSTVQRTKEIGIRKVLGASVSGIVNLLSTDFLKLVVIAFAIAVPLAWYFMHRWLEDFAYHTDINVWVFVLAGICALTIAFVTVSFQAIKAAVTNPVKSLRTE
jgi:putative ABC transport system permease protein